MWKRITKKCSWQAASSTPFEHKIMQHVSGNTEDWKCFTINLLTKHSQTPASLFLVGQKQSCWCLWVLCQSFLPAWCLSNQLIFLFIDIIVHGHGVIANHASFLGRIAAVCTRTDCTAVQVWLSTTTTPSGTPSSAPAGDKLQHSFRGSRLWHPFRNKYRNCCWVSGMVWCKNLPPTAIWTRKRIDREGPPP